LLERYAEPLAALVPGFTWPEGPLRHAWRLLLWNGAHDSVCGCSVDEVARAVDDRYAEAEAIAGEISHDALVALAARMPRPGWMYFNPSPFERFGLPGLGWQVGADIPFHPPISLTVEDGSIVASEHREIRFRLVDEGDVGDLYNFCPTSVAPPAEPLGLIARDGAVTASFDGLEVELRADAGPELVSVRLDGWIRNERPDHRLRLHVSLDEKAVGSTALAPFEVVQRPLAGEGGAEIASPTWPARGAVLAGGVAVLQEGVFEYEVVPDPPELAVTLLRCVGTISRPQIATRGWAAGPDIPTPDAQMFGEQRFSLAIQRGLRPAQLPAEWERAMLFIRAVRAPGGGDLPATGSLLEIEGAELSSVRRVDDELEVRIWNPADEPRRARIGEREISLGPARIETVRL
jgi:hypothetical protein